ncbi:MAG: zf-HC2 domain-containing protein [Bacillota bacterium]|nr:zf-HC2 domain-containing protein [Bacillota bacterium]
MDCRSIDNLIQLNIDKQLSPAAQAYLAEHLAACEDCRAAESAYMALDALLKQELPRVEPPAGFSAAVMAALPAARDNAVVFRPRRKQGWLYGLAACAAAVALFFGIWVLEGDPAENFPLIAPPVIAHVDEPEPTEAEVATEPLQVAEADPEPIEPEAATEPEPQHYSTSTELPAVAYNSELSGEYAQLLLASYADYDAICPVINGDTVSYYTEIDGVKLVWMVPLNGGEPLFEGETESIPSPLSVLKAADRSAEAATPCISATSPDTLSVALNYGGDRTGLWLGNVNELDQAVQVDANGGGSLLGWAPAGNKLLYTDAAGALHIYYIAEQFALTVYPSSVHSACWSADGLSIVFAALGGENGHYNIYKVSVP